MKQKKIKTLQSTFSQEFSYSVIGGASSNNINVVGYFYGSVHRSESSY